jgi:hypothetical protein
VFRLAVWDGTVFDGTDAYNSLQYPNDTEAADEIGFGT